MAAFILLCSQNQDEMVSGILDMNFFIDVALTHFQSSAPDQIIGRLAALTTNFLVTNPQKAFSNLEPLMFAFLDYVDNSSVLNFYENIFSNAAKATKAQIMLIERGIPHEIAKRIEEIDINRVSEIWDRYFLKFAGLYKLISTACNHAEYVDHFCTPEILAALTRTFRSLPSYVDGARWDAVISIMNKKSIKEFDLFIPLAISKLIGAISAPSTDVVSCINFITKLFALNESSIELLVNSQIIQIILRIAIQFENSSILLSAFAKFTMECLNHDISCDKVLNSYIPLFIATFNSPHYSNFVASSRLILVQISEEAKSSRALSKKLEKVEIYKDFKLSTLDKYRKKIDTHYGGDVFVNIAFTN